MSWNKLTKEDVNDRLSSRGIVMLGDYVNSQTKSRFQNKDGYTWEATPATVMSTNDCQQRTGRPRLTNEIINERLADRGILILDEYEHQKIKARFLCSQGHTWKARPNNVLSGKGCPKCGSISAASKKRLTLDVIRKRLLGRGIDLVGEYLGSLTKTRFRCLEDHSWEATPASIIKGNGCPHCAGNAPLTKETVNARIAERGITLAGDYGGAHTNTLFQCNNGHTWDARPNNIIQGKNCPHCAGQFPLSEKIVNERIAGRGLTLLGIYVNTSTKAQFKCREGHTWEASPGNVLGGCGCPHCHGKNLPLTKKIVNDRIADRGLFLLDEYVNNSAKRRFQCGEEHIWETAPANVLSGRGCPVCADHTSDNDVFYLWVAGPQELVHLRDCEFLLKYGVTSERRGDVRIREVGYAWNTDPTVLALVKTMGPAIWVENTVARIGRCLSSDYSHLDGWTEFRIVNDAELAHLMAIAAEAAEYKITWNNPVPHIKEYHLEQLKLDLR